MTKPLHSASPSRTVTIQGRDYGWDPAKGLDPDAVVGVEGFIRKKAWAYKGWAESVGLEVDDLVQEGFTGALKSASKFNPEFGTKFLTYSSWYIDAAMREALGRRIVRTPEGRTHAWVGSLDAPRGTEEGDEGATFMEVQEDKAPGPLELSMEAEQRALVLAALPALDPRSREVVLRHTGLDGRKPESLVIIAEDLGISRQRASQILERVAEDLSVELAG